MKRPRVPEEEAELTSDSLACVSPDLIDLMREAVIGADLDQLLARIQEVEAAAPEIARGLRRLAEQFEYQKLLGLFGPGLPRSGASRPPRVNGSATGNPLKTPDHDRSKHFAGT